MAETGNLGAVGEMLCESMRLALNLAHEAAQDGEVPVGAVVVGPDGAVLGRGRNLREHGGDPLAHAEVEAMRQAAATQGNWNLADCTLVVTLEPCPMCAAASCWAQVGRIVYGALDPKRGYSLFSPSLLHPKTEVVPGVLAETCGGMVSEFFRKKR